MVLACYKSQKEHFCTMTASKLCFLESDSSDHHHHAINFSKRRDMSLLAVLVHAW